MISGRCLRRDEIVQIWTMDRSETIEHVYYFERDALVLKPERHDMKGWPPEKADICTPLFQDCFDRGGWFYGLFDGAALIAIAVLESRLIGAARDQLQLDFLHVSRPYRRRGLAKHLFSLACAEARRRGARRLYISATPSENTIGFYLRRGCIVTAEPDPELFALEPDDIHLECIA